ncbi:suppressor of deletion of TFIIS [Mitosporidium daphniae]|uniref:Pyrimidine 5-nucleotidase n=1 Tax=Mitosporidium daphniae TaxID=1485682 RepID=A0A098VW14_9MICR|nr:uncharacterized protein DI09_10p390 [Mitosporidium daphniae]KGG53142.1 hypothetical protein DI09_10p390 [Mitosporidium daphniae]|eukprot:XP_013239569.1 uncharacterized protein DI09_10p390 [Mitosporidium daphniae]
MTQQVSNLVSPRVELAAPMVDRITSTFALSGDISKDASKETIPIKMYAMPSSHSHLIDFDPICEFYHQPSMKYASDLQIKQLTETDHVKLAGKKVLFFDMDNCLYPQSSGISDVVRQRILSFCATVHNMSEEEAYFLAQKYHTDYGLAIKGLLLHHPGTDPSQYDTFVDGGIDIKKSLPNHSPKKIINLFDKIKTFGIEHVWILTNAGSSHSLHTLSFLFGVQFERSEPSCASPSWFDGIIYCDYSVPNFLCKPQLSLFRAVTKIASTPQGHFPVLIDDSLSNIYGALRCGWRAIWVSEDAPKDAVFLENDRKYMHFEGEKDNFFIVIRTVYDTANVINFV